MNTRLRRARQNGVDALALTVHLFSDHFTVSPKFLVKVLPMLGNEIPSFPLFLFGIHHHGVSSPDAEYLLHRAIECGRIVSREAENKRLLWCKPRIRMELLPNVSSSQVDDIAQELGLCLPLLRQKVATLATRYGGNPENIEKASLKLVLDKFREPTAWLYWSCRWEEQQFERKYRGLKQISIGPLSLPVPDFVRELKPPQRLIFNVYASVMKEKEAPNSDYHFRINALKKHNRTRDLSGEKVVLFGYLLGTPTKIDDGTERLSCRFCDSFFFPNKGHKIDLILDSSGQGGLEKGLKELLRYELMVLGTIVNTHINASAVLRMRTLPEIFSRKNEEKQVTLLELLKAS